jgi:predicted permease
MGGLKSLWLGLRALFHRGQTETDLDEEMRFHLEMQIEHNLAQGMSRTQAKRAAQLAFGGLDQAKENSRDAWGLCLVVELLRDFRLGVRSLRRSPGFSLTAIVTLGLGIGACVTMFSVIQSVMLKPLGVRDQDRLVYFWENNLKLGISSFSQSVPNFVDYRDQSQSFEALIGLNTLNVNLSDLNQRPVQASAVAISAGFSEVLGWPLVLGRGFNAAEDQPGGPKVVVLSEALWRERYRADPNILTRTIDINREAHQVIGVISDAANFFAPVDLWRPLSPDPTRVNRDDHRLTVVGRLAPGVSIAQAQAEVDAIAAGLRETHPETMDGWGAYLESFYHEHVPAELTHSLSLLFGAVGLLLLIACANVANLLLSQALARDQELAIRTALGASRWQIMRQLLCEAAALALGGTLLSLLLSSWGISLLRLYTPVDALPRGDQIALDPQGLLFTLAVGIITVFAAGLIPAFRLSRVNPGHAIGATTRTIGFSARKSRTRSALVVVQVALSLVLVVGAGLVLKSYHQLQNTDAGYNRAGVLSFQITPDSTAYSADETRLGFYDRIKAEINALPGVTHTALSSGLPFGSGTTSLNLFTPEPSALHPEDSIQSSWRIIDEDYFRVMQIPLVAGRTFTPDDDGKVPAIIISRRLAERFWPAESAVGKRVSPGGGGNTYLVIGVVEDIRLTDLTGVSERPQMYLPLRHWTGWPTMSFAVRAEIAPASLTASIRTVIQQIDPEQPVFDFNTLAGLSERATRNPKFQSWLLGVFASIALLLAAIGIYAVMQTIVTQRTREIGVRMALGAQAGETMALIFRQGGRLVLLGLGTGAVLLWPVLSTLEQHLFEMQTLDLGILSLATAAISLAAFAAIALPTRRAVRINPIEALRGD